MLSIRKSHCMSNIHVCDLRPSRVTIAVEQISSSSILSPFKLVFVYLPKALGIEHILKVTVSVTSSRKVLGPFKYG